MSDVDERQLATAEEFWRQAHVLWRSTPSFEAAVDAMISVMPSNEWWQQVRRQVMAIEAAHTVPLLYDETRRLDKPAYRRAIAEYAEAAHMHGVTADQFATELLRRRFDQRLNDPSVFGLATRPTSHTPSDLH